MAFNIKNSWVLITFLSLGTLSYFLGMCGVRDTCAQYSLLAPHSYTIFEPVLLYSITAGPLAVLLIFVRDDVFNRWLQFARWWVPLSVLLVAVAPLTGNSFASLYPDPTKENLTWLMGGLFTVVSFVLASEAFHASAKSHPRRDD